MPHHRAIWLLVLIVGLWLTGGPLMACPYMAQTRSCCPVSSHSAPQCPLSKSMQNCPVFASSEKLGPTQATLHASPLASVETVPVQAIERLWVPSVVQPVWRPSGPDLLHRVGVLRI